LIQIIPILIVAPLFIRGKAEFGVITQSSMAFAHIVGAFSLVITQFQQISSYAVVMARLEGLIETVDQVTSKSAAGSRTTTPARLSLGSASRCARPAWRPRSSTRFPRRSRPARGCS
jgi:ABC-type uncharacterized transport system fused permease/ATPase subunit